MEALHIRLGRMEYGRALAVQKRIHRMRVEGKIPDVLLTVEHEPVFTRGRSTREGGFLVSEAEIARAGIAVHDVDRGGDITYHGPGQLVAYPIVDLRRYGKDVRKYVEILEEAGILTLTAFGVPSARRAGYPGVWVHQEKIGSIGVYVKNWVTRHGMALNVGVDPAHFAMIRPCGLPVHAVSMNDFVEPAVDVRDVESRFVEALKGLLGWRLETVDPASVPGALDE